MSKFRERAAEVKAAGEEARGDFTPHGVPKRMYQWWLEHSLSSKAAEIRTGKRRENFCHFWRVVVIWTPLLFVANKFFGALDAIGERFSPKQIVAAIVLFVLACTALVVTSVGDWSEFLKVIGFGALFLVAISAIFFVLYLIIEKTENGYPILMGLVGLGFVSFVTYSGFQEVGWWVFLIELGVVAGIAAFFGLVIVIGSAVDSLRADRRRRQADAHNNAYSAWLKGEGPNPYETQPKEPGKFSKFFSGVGDFLVLLTQVVRVNKWKICPLVEVDVPAKDSRPMPGAPEWS